MPEHCHPISWFVVFGTAIPTSLYICVNTFLCAYCIKYEKHFPKMYRNVGMAVPKTTQTRYMDGSVQAT